jgi:ABC-2 type transport system permease protein
MGLEFRVIGAIFRREMGSYLVNPAGYVFLTLFIASTGAAAFLRAGFFARNLADLAQLNQVMPAVLMLFVPAITMNVWAEERRSGTEELLLTLPVRDVEVILGKYLGALGVYTVALGFSLAHVVVLAYLGSPDPGLMFSTYLGYWLMGALFVSIGILASLFTANATVAFILGAVGCSGLVLSALAPWAAGLLGAGLFAGSAALVTLVVTGAAKNSGWAALAGGAAGVLLWRAKPEWFEETFRYLAVGPHFFGFGEGVLRLGDVVFFVGGTAVVLYLCAYLLGRRHW